MSYFLNFSVYIYLISSYICSCASQDNIEDCPVEFQPVAMRSCNKLWKDHKAKTKDKYYTKHEEDPDILLKVPKRVLPDQWEELVSYWRTTDAKVYN